MNVLGRIFGALGLKVKRADGMSFQGPRLPSDDDLAALLARMGREPIQFAPPGPRLNVITTSSKAEAPAVHAFDKPEPRPEPEADAGGLRALWRRLRRELDEHGRK